jgi:ubiquinone/menaquinone biosynthesis C-methylase UbiE
MAENDQPNENDKPTESDQPAEGDQPEGSKGTRRVYYDHEPAYKAISEAGGTGWDDLPQSQRPESCDDIEQADSYVALERFMASSWMPAKGAGAIELGCGGGQATLKLAERGLEAVGVDFSETAIELAHKNAEEAGLDCEFAVGDVTDLEQFGDDAFDLVVDNHCLHCLVEPADREAFLREAARLLRPGGVFFSETMTREGNFDPEKFDIDPETYISSAHTRIWVSKLELDEELRAANFNVVHTYSRHQDSDAGYTFVNYALAR